MKLDAGSRLLSDLVFVRTYSEKKSTGKKERAWETIDRVSNMHVAKFPHLEDQIDEVFKSVHDRTAVPSMRSMQFAGYSIDRSNIRIFNCAYSPIEAFKDIADIAYISMNGAGVGYSVQGRHVDQLPIISLDILSEVVVIQDTKESWADSILAVLKNPAQQFLYNQIRPKGSQLSTGGTASGPDSLMMLHDFIRTILLGALGRKLRPIEVHDIMCHTGDLVFCGGVRRTALICLFDVDDEEMLTCKYGDWWIDHPQRARACNSAVIHRNDPAVEGKIRNVMQHCFNSNAGEPALFLTNDYNWGINPCGEVGLPPRSFCNLTEINAASCDSVDTFLQAIGSATAIGTLQASYTNFDYLDPRWKKNCEEEALLGVSITGQAEAQHLLTPENLRMGAAIAIETNRRWAEMLGINPANRIGCTKPSGSTSAWLGTTSGVHGAHSDYFLRRVRVDRMANAPIVKYLIDIFGESEPMTDGIVERDAASPDLVVVTVPIRMDGAIKRSEETAIELLERAKRIYDNWIVPSHVQGENHHNVSLTVSYREHEKREIIDWVVRNRDSTAGVSFLPYSNTSYKQMPFQSVTKAEYEWWVSRFPEGIDLFSLDYRNEVDQRKQEASCSANGCEIY